MTEYGPEIRRGTALWAEGQDRPVWLNDKDLITREYDDGWNDNGWISTHKAVWRGMVAIRLPAYAPASIAQRWNNEHPNEPPFTRVWFGENDDGPEDYGGDGVLFGNGIACVGFGWLWSNDGSGVYGRALVVAYRPKPEPATAPEPIPTYNPETHAVVERMSEAQAKKLWGYVDGTADMFVNRMYDLGIIGPASLTERITAIVPMSSADAEAIIAMVRE